MLPLRILISSVMLIFLISSLQAQQWQYSNNNAYYNSGHVGIGTDAPSTPWSKVLQVYDFNNASLSVKTQVAEWHILTAANGGLDFRDITGGGNAERLFIASNGNIGVGTTTPLSRLSVLTNALGSNNGDRINLSSFETNVGVNTSLVDLYSYRNASGNDWLSTTTRLQQRIDGSNMGYLEFNPPGMTWGLALGTNNMGRLYIGNNGNIGIGTVSINDDTYRLFVEKGIRTRKIKVDLAGWSDYVFQATYHLRPLSEVEQYIQQHHHLPEVPSAAEVESDGLDLGDNQVTLLKKIEELTLYLIEQNKRIEKLEAANEQLRLENQMRKTNVKK